jgi:hypothetical protein
VRRCSNSRVSRICESVLFVTVARISLGYNFYNAETVQEDAFGACGGNLLIQRAENCFEFEAAITGDELHSLRERWIQSQPHRPALREKCRGRTLQGNEFKRSKRSRLARVRFMPRNWSLSQCSVCAVRGSWLVSRTKSKLRPRSVDFLYLYFPQLSPIEPDAQHVRPHNSLVFACRGGNPTKFALSRNDGLVFNAADFDLVVQPLRNLSIRVRNGERDSGFICLKKYGSERCSPCREH